MVDFKTFKSKRFLLSLLCTTILAAMGVIALYKNMTEVAVSVVPFLGGIAAYYTKKESDRPSSSK